MTICPASAGSFAAVSTLLGSPILGAFLIMEVAGIEVGGVEYVIDDRTGQLLYYDVNALSNFVSDPERVIGFNPYARLADYLIAEARVHEASRGERFVSAGSLR